MAPFNELLRKYREAAELSQEQLARKAGISTSALSKLEQTLREPTWNTVQRLSLALGVDPKSFVDVDLEVPEPKPAPKRRRKEN